MNTLSWFLYLAEVVSNLSTFFFFIGFMGTLIGGFTCAYLQFELRSSRGWKWLGVPFFFVLLSAVLPSKTTIYAVAASEMGEKVYQSQQGQKIVSLLEQYIDKQLKEIKK